MLPFNKPPLLAKSLIICAQLAKIVKFTAIQMIAYPFAFDHKDKCYTMIIPMVKRVSVWLYRRKMNVTPF